MPQQIGRVAFRQEGSMWNAYYAEQHTMEGAILLGSITVGLVVGKPDVKAAFMNVMQMASKKLFSEALGAPVEFPDGPIPAPEHERSGGG